MKATVTVNLEELKLEKGLVREVDGLNNCGGWVTFTVETPGTVDEVKEVWIDFEAEVKDAEVIKVIVNSAMVMDGLLDTRVNLSNYNDTVELLEEELKSELNG